MYYKRNYNLFNGVYFNQVFKERKVLAKFISIILNCKVDEFDIEYLDNSVFNLGSKGVYDIYFNIKGTQFIRINLENKDYDYSYMIEKIQCFNSALVTNVFTNDENIKKYNTKSIFIINSTKFKGNEFVTHINCMENSTNIVKAENIIDIRIINLNYLSNCNNKELKEFLELFSFDYSELIKRKFNTILANNALSKIKEFNTENYLVNKSAFVLEKEEMLENTLLFDINKKENIINNMVITMFNNKYDIETISKVSNLEEDEILEIISKK